MLSRGYQVRDPDTGAVLVDNDDARAVWGFQQIRMDLRCDTLRSCELRGYRPREERPLWRADLPGAVGSVVGVNPDLATAGVSVPARMHAAVSGPPPIPPLIGVPTDRRRVSVVSSATGQVVGQYEAASDELIMVVGDRVIRSTATRRDGVCLLAVSGYDLVTDTPVWGPEPYNLRTITGGGCDQRYAAVAAGAALVVVDPEGAERVIDASDGRVLWRGEPGERVQGLTEHLAVVKAADDPTVRYAVMLDDQGGQRVWQRTVHADAEVMLTRCGVVVVDRDPDRIHVWDPVDGESLLTVRTSARVLACTADGLILADRRAIALATFDGVFPEPAGGSRDDGGSDGVNDGGGIGRDDKDNGGTPTGPGGGPGPDDDPGQLGGLR
jgi:outer membrane protein assembly factor BamB